MTEPASIWEFALRHLTRLRTPYGFAASEAETGHYAALFGRDSLWMILFLLQAKPLVASPEFESWVKDAVRDVLVTLARHQGTQYIDEIEEQPGKIIHEYRESIDARLEAMSIRFREGRSYSGIDETFLFVIACCLAVEQFGPGIADPAIRLGLEHALTWVETCADEDHDGLVEYSRRSEENLLNQTWRDSFDSLVTTGEDIPRHPIRWLSVQSYAFKAWNDAGRLYRRFGDIKRAEELGARATALAQRVQRAFWMADEDCYAIALDRDKKPIGMVSSDAGHALWSGIVEPSKRLCLIRRLLRPDMMTSYGLRSLSSASAFFAPFSYHRGNVWPFDNAIFVSGLMAEGFFAEAASTVRGVAAALEHLGGPYELYVVLDRALFLAPQIEPESALLLRRPNQENRNQGWTAAGLVYMAAALASIVGTKLDFAHGKRSS